MVPVTLDSELVACWASRCRVLRRPKRSARNWCSIGLINSGGAVHISLEGMASPNPRSFPKFPFAAQGIDGRPDISTLRDDATPQKAKALCGAPSQAKEDGSLTCKWALPVR